MSLKLPLRTVVLLGAGASHASRFRLPTMAGFFGEDIGRRPELAAFLSWFYRGRDPHDYNLEEVLGFLDLSRARAGTWGFSQARPEPYDAERLYESLLDFIALKLAVPSEDICPIHERLFSCLDSRDSIISLNYDLIADFALMRRDAAPDGTLDTTTPMGKVLSLLGDPSYKGEHLPTLLPSEREKGFYLKLHGSLDWLRCPSTGCPNNARFYSQVASRFPLGQMRGKPCRICGAALRTFIMPPVASKRFEDTGRLALLWHLALREIAEAERLVVFGLSLAPSDFELRWLLRQGVALRDAGVLGVHLINKDAGHRARFFELLPKADKEFYEHESIDNFFSHIARDA